MISDDEIRQIRGQINDGRNQLAWRLLDEVDRLRAENAKGREALRFYANQQNYSWRPVFGCKTYGYVGIMDDKGDRARQALKEIE